MARLNNMVAVITGGAGGIGKATAKRFLEEGAKVALVDISEEALSEVEKELDSGNNVLTITADVSSEPDVKNYVNKVIDTFGKIDVFFNNAGVEGEPAPIVDTDVSEFDKVTTINIRGVFLGMKHVLPFMIKQESGSIINTSSVAGLFGFPMQSPYTASKHAVAGMTKSVAIEVAPKGIRVNSIHPAPVDTRMMDNMEKMMSPDDTDAAKKEFQGSIPIGRYAEAVEIADLVVFLASNESKYITGSQYNIDGGMNAS